MEDQLPCPHCGEMISDLWDFNWENEEVIISECSECLKPIDIIRKVSVSYRIEKGT